MVAIGKLIAKLVLVGIIFVLFVIACKVLFAVLSIISIIASILLAIGIVVLACHVLIPKCKNYLGNKSK